MWVLKIPLSAEMLLSTAAATWRFNSSTLKMKNNGTINVNSGGYLSMEGMKVQNPLLPALIRQTSINSLLILVA